MSVLDQQAAAQLFDDAALPWLQAQRTAARAAWLGGKIPTRKTEAWKYTRLEVLAEQDYLPSLRSGLADAGQAGPLIDGLDADWLVFIDGRFEPSLSSVRPQSGVTAVRFSAADDVQRQLIARHFSTLAHSTENPFIDLNGCWLTDGVLLHVAAGVKAERPLCVAFLGAADDRPVAAAQRTLVVLEEQAQAQLIEYFPQAPGSRNSLLTGATEVALAASAQLEHCRLHLEEEHAVHIGGVYVDLGRAARYQGFVMGLGGRLKRLDMRIRHRGQGSECHTDGIYLVRHTQHFDLHSTVEHEATHGTTAQVFRGIVDDSARAVFNGRIHIHPQAQKTSADLSNRNLLLSNEAEIDTKPELEIYADDVRCSHGATVSRIDENSLYYLQTRGIARPEAELLLGFGFVNELLNRVSPMLLQELLRAVVRGWFGRAADPLGELR